MKVLESQNLQQISGGMNLDGLPGSSNVIDLTYESEGWVGYSYPGGFNYSDPNYGNEGRNWLLGQ